MAAQIHQFMCLEDNFGVLIHDPTTGATASMDAPEAGPILAALKIPTMAAHMFLLYYAVMSALTPAPPWSIFPTRQGSICR